MEDRSRIADPLPGRPGVHSARDYGETKLEGDRLYEIGEFAAAQNVFQSLVEESQSDSWCLFQLGRIAARQERWTEAIKNFDAVLACPHPVVWAFYEKALALQQAGGEPEAVARTLLDFIERPPDDLAEGHYEAIVMGAHLAFQAEAYDHARCLYEFVTKRGQAKYIVKLRCADIQLQQGDAEAALRRLEQLADDPEYDLWADVTKARALLKLERYEEAGEILKRLITQSPGNPLFVQLLFDALEGCENYEQLAYPEEFFHGLTTGQRFQFLLRARLACRDYVGALDLYDEYPELAASATSGLLSKAINVLKKQRDFPTIDRLIEKTGTKLDADTGLPYKRAAVVCWDLSHSPAGRAAVLYKLLENDWSVELIGPMWLQFEQDLWRPLRGESLRIKSFHALNITDIWRNGAAIALTNNYDIVIVSKPRLPGLVIGLLLAEQSRCPLLIDIDEDELAFSQKQPIKQQSFARELFDEPFNTSGTHLAYEHLTVADAFTVSNPALLQQFSGHVVRHARDEAMPLVDRDAARLSLGLASDDFVIAFIGTARLHKGISHIIAALRTIEDSRVKLLLAGTVAKETDDEIQRAKLTRRIVRHDEFDFSDIGRFLAAADLVPILQDTDAQISQTQIPAKLTDALQYGVPVVATDVPPIRDMAERGVVDLITGGDFVQYLRNVVKRPLTSSRRERLRQIFLDEFSLAANRLTLERAIADAMGRFDPSSSKVTETLHELLTKTRAPLADRASRNAKAAPTVPRRRDIIFFWKQNDSGLFGRRSDMVIKYLLKSDRVGRLIHFDHSVSIEDLRHMAEEKCLGRRTVSSLQFDQTMDRVFKLSDNTQLKRRVCVLDDNNAGFTIAGQSACQRDLFAEFILEVLRTEGLNPEHSIAWVWPVVHGFAAAANKLSFEKVIVDLIDDQRTWPATDNKRAIMEREYTETLRIADLVFTNCQGNRNRFARARSDIIVIPNGAEVESSPGPAPMPQQLRRLPRPIIGYLGNLRDRIDWRLVTGLAKRRPSWSFVFAGPMEEERLPPELAEAPNLHFPGPVPYDRSHTWMRNFDVAIVPHLRSAMTESMNPLKVYNYLAAGCQTVSTPVANLEEVADLILVKDNVDDFIAAIEDRLSSPLSIPQERLESLSWERRVALMLDKIETLS
jgi:glycosyltransferase involved in cell wall biosynthesis/predicted negative regulator of RcsB-dependent stress response